MLTAAFVFVFLYALAEANSDKATIAADLPIDHKKGGWERATCMVGFAFLSHWRALQEPELFTTDQAWVLLSIATIFCCLILYFWVCFDVLLNVLRNKSIVYIGQDKRTAWLDKQARKFIKVATDGDGAGLIYLMVKLIALSFFVTLYTALV